MSSEEEQQPGPSGVSREEVLTLLGLNTSDSEDEENESILHCPETLDESEDEEDRYCRLALEELERQYEAEDQWCNQALEDFERQRAFQTQLLQQSGGGLDANTSLGTFEFDLDPFMERTSTHLGVRERIINTRLRQTGNFIDTPHVAQALRDALQRAMTRALNQFPDLHEDDRLFFTISSNRLARGDFQGWGVRVGEWRRGGGDRVDALLNRLSRALNSNEQFEMDDSFQMRITHVQRPPQGTGSKRRLKPGHQTLALLKPKKKSIVQIRNTDDLCCARALVTAKAKVDQHSQWYAFKDGRKIQKDQALLLHHDANVPLGPCGYEELTQFSQAPSLYDYQILLVDADRAFNITSFGHPNPDKQLVLLHEKGHYTRVYRVRWVLCGQPIPCEQSNNPTDPQWVQTARSPTRQDPFHRFSQFLPNASGRVSQNLWTHGTEKGVLPPQIQPPRAPRVRGTHPGHRLLHARNHVLRRTAKVRSLAQGTIRQPRGL